MTPWYKKFGPLSWYTANGRIEWIELCLTLGNTVLLIAHVKPRSKYVSLAVGGRVSKRSMFGKPSIINPWTHLSAGGIHHAMR